MGIRGGARVHSCPLSELSRIRIVQCPDTHPWPPTSSEKCNRLDHIPPKPAHELLPRFPSGAYRGFRRVRTRRDSAGFAADEVRGLDYQAKHASATLIVCRPPLLVFPGLPQPLVSHLRDLVDCDGKPARRSCCATTSAVRGLGARAAPSPRRCTCEAEMGAGDRGLPSKLALPLVLVSAPVRSFVYPLGMHFRWVDKVPEVVVLLRVVGVRSRDAESGWVTQRNAPQRAVQCISIQDLDGSHVWRKVLQIGTTPMRGRYTSA